ncbi:MAG: NADH-quinone oxidoreductase subunit NuoG [Legionellales bacterium]|nr:NADH-quinone oxidoreductase subunit NuoG [Legionellales bacterium]
MMAKIEIDGKTFEVENGKMIIEVADEAGIHIPRFCYHKKLSVAANCRMCLVEVEKNRKTVPACATPVNDGMKIFTRSPAALQSQKAVMEFLLINHPLDCPICDQGGECELQDVAMGFGQDRSIFEETKRAVANDDLGSLIATEMTRCIQCTRCVRFGEEVAGLPELGCIDRGEKLQISTYVAQSMVSEVSANIIDLCPVGALTSKPYRFTARPWEMTQAPSIAPHDCLGSHVYLHSRRDRLMRVIPKEQESINETWLSDRDRFSYLGLQHQARAARPKIKRNGVWEYVDWQTALDFASKSLQQIIKQYGPESFAAFASSSSTLEEGYLLQKMLRSLGVHNIDHRLQQTDFRDQDLQGVMPVNTLPYSDLEKQQHILVVGCNVDREAPLLGIRIRKANLNGASVCAMNVVDYPYHFDLHEKLVVSPQDLPMQLALILVSLVKKKDDLLEQERALTVGLKATEQSKLLAQELRQPGAVIVSGAVCDNHPEAALIRTLLAALAKYSGAKMLRLTTGANAAGAALVGLLPHRSVAGKLVEKPGLDVQAALVAKLKGYLLLGVEPEFDCANPFLARRAMLAAEHVIVLSAFESEAFDDYADVILPIAPYAETSGTYVNLDGTWQSFAGAVSPHGEARPAWKVLRVLANHLHCAGFDYLSSQDVLQEVQQQYAFQHDIASGYFYPDSLPETAYDLVRAGEWSLYRSDMLVRHAEALQACGAADTACARVHSETAKRLNLGDMVTVSQGDIGVTLPLFSDDRIAMDTVWVANAMLETIDLGSAFGPVTIK